MIKNHRIVIGCSALVIVLCSTVGLIASCVNDVPVNRMSEFTVMFAVLMAAGSVILYSNYKDIDYDKKLDILYSRGEDDEFKSTARAKQGNQFFKKVKNFLYRKNSSTNQSQYFGDDIDEYSIDELHKISEFNSVGERDSVGKRKNYGSIKEFSQSIETEVSLDGADSLMESAEIQIQQNSNKGIRE
ncbi:hypothetical protein EDL79_01945 [Ehrlichia ruminantium]|uniref:Lipoprotein n=1 Tax=Ehrlichia ruminantium TaxID=779 RepID=A0AAE6QAP1_EHRRU|nr:hypothetical protein [Ehrlichia ruminantium]QGR02429.1 hypothetical protein EDL81_01950 [Ehrlichia ruminantium]QGR03348.1 hypothetical protein EDL80_01945 [Ehrlichia ruminantium]QGR04275.1 hypothetical protein EDL79_01945 [Ehrlichia ruminantium]